MKTPNAAAVVAAEGLLRDNLQIIIRGPAGSGKTTLMNWITWSCSKGGPGNIWNGGIPFVIPLRRVAVDENGPPKVNQFVAYSVDPGVWSLGTPHGWIDSILRLQKRGVIILDGVDELPAARRAGFWEWLANFTVQYPGNRVVVTSRTLPGSTSADGKEKTEQWNPPSEFIECQLQEMSDSDISKFVQHWHNAVDRVKLDAFEMAALVKARDELPGKLSDPANRRIRELCSTPLLCALICVLHWHDEGYLPRQRVDIYNRCCDMLIEARDLKRGIQPPVGAVGALSKDDKELVLQRLALDMLRNRPDSDEPGTTYRIEISRTKAVEWIGARISSFQSAEARTAQPEQVLDYLIERTGLLREPSGGRVDFPHRTFQEYLAACAAGAEGQEVSLAKQADDDQWHETIMLAAGTPTGGIQFGRSLIEALVKRGEQHKSQKSRSQRIRKTCFALALGCLENLRQQDPEIRDRVVSHISDLVPPHNQGDARILSVAGDAAVGFLRYQNWKDERTTTLAACAQALRLIATTNAAQELAEGYVTDNREGVVAEVCASGLFSYERISLVAQYVEKHGRLPTYASTNNIQHLVDLKGLKFLDLIGRVPRNSHLIQNLLELESLGLREMSTDDIKNIEFPPSVRVVRIYGCTGDDYSWVSAFKHLTALRLVAVKGQANLSFIEKSDDLNSLSISHSDVADITSLGTLGKIETVSLDECDNLSDLSVLTDLKQLKKLKITDCSNVNDLSIVEKLDNIESLTIERCSTDAFVAILDRSKGLSHLCLNAVNLLNPSLCLASLPSLSDVNFTSMPCLEDLNFVRDLSELKRLVVRNCRQILSIDPVANCHKLEALTLHRTSIVSLEGLQNCRDLQSLILGECVDLEDISQISALSNLTELKLTGIPSIKSLNHTAGLRCLKTLHLQDLNSLSSLTFIEALSDLERISLIGCKLLFDLEPLSQLQSLRSLTIVACPGITDLTHLEKCKSLQSIELSRGVESSTIVPEAVRPKVSYPYIFSHNVPYRAARLTPHYIFRENEDRPITLVYYEDQVNPLYLDRSVE